MGPLCRVFQLLNPFQAVHFWDFLLICADGRTEDGRTLAPGGPEERNRRFAQLTREAGTPTTVSPFRESHPVPERWEKLQLITGRSVCQWVGSELLSSFVNNRALSVVMDMKRIWTKIYLCHITVTLKYGEICFAQYTI